MSALLGTSNAWFTIHMSHRPIQPQYYILDWWISCCSSQMTYKAVLSRQKSREQALLAYCSNIYNVVCVLLSKNEPQKTHRRLLITACNCTNIWRKTQTYVHQKNYCIQRKILNLCTIQYCSCFKNKLHIQKRAWWLFKFEISSYFIINYCLKVILTRHLRHVKVWSFLTESEKAKKLFWFISMGI